MSEETIRTIGQLLESSLEEAEDPEMRYKLRTALQLLSVQREDCTRLEEAAAAADPSLRNRLTELGYLD